MIIKDDHGEIMINSRVRLHVSQNGNEWVLFDTGDGIELELIDGPAHNVGVVALGPRVVKVKPMETHRQSTPTRVGISA